jgi:hypothetical protein
MIATAIDGSRPGRTILDSPRFWLTSFLRNENLCDACPLKVLRDEVYVQEAAPNPAGQGA